METLVPGERIGAEDREMVLQEIERDTGERRGEKARKRQGRD